MDSDDEVLILSVEDSADCLCLGQKGKGKGAAQPGRRKPKKSAKASEDAENCLVIVDSSEDGYVEVSGGGGGGRTAATPKDSDLESVVGPPPKKLHMSGSHEAELAIVRVTSKKPTQDKFDENGGTEDGRKAVSVPSSASALPDMSEYIPETNPSEQPSTTTEDPSLSSVPPQSLVSGTVHERVPTCWTNCPNCPPDMQRTYHLIDVAYNCAEWSVVSNALTQLGFVVNRVQRIQNESLWQRLCYEKKLMLRDRHDVNEQLLYHTSRTAIPIICEEGLDHRLSMNGSFGHGIYFR